MLVAPSPTDETERLVALSVLEILDTAPSVEWDIYPKLAAQLPSTPMAAISFVDQDRNWFKASVGLDVAEIPRSGSFCAHAILAPGQVFCVPDARQDPRFADNPLVTGSFGLRFYAGVPILGPTGLPKGTLCVLDHKPRRLDPAVTDGLRLLATGVSATLRSHVVGQGMRKLGEREPLTGLLNRAAFESRLRARLAQGGARVGVLLIDLDCFKAVNELFGHNGGDAVLLEVAQRLRSTARARDSVARFGGDEFCILVDDIRDQSEMRALATRIHSAVTAPILVDREPLVVRTSIGAALSTDGGDGSEDLLRHADAALYDAKRSGRGTTRFSHEMAPSGRFLATGRIELEDLLRSALLPPGREPFTLALQPISQGRSGCLAGFEALVRWPGPDGSVRQPGEFMPIAESTGLVVHLDRWVLDRACSLAAGWPAHLQVSSNLSAANFYAGNLVETVRTTLARHGIAPGRLKLEITESVLLCEPARVQGTIAALRDLGVNVVLDDFGVGFASIAYLRDYAFDGLKIDRSFTAGIETDLRSRAFVQAIIDMARALDVQTTAEGVETEGQLRLLRDKGIGTVQGYLLGRPMTPADASLVIQRQELPASA